MATISDIVQRIRYRCRDTRGGTFSDAQILDAVNVVVQDVHRLLSNIQSNLVYATATIATVAGTRKYQVPGISSPLPDVDGVRLSGEVAPLTQVMEHALTILGDDGTERGKPEYWFLTAPVSGVAQIGFSPIPDDSYTVEIFYKPAQVVFSSVDTTPMPYGGIWDNYITLQAALELRETVEGDVTYLMARSLAAYNQAMQETYRRGMQHLRPSPYTGFFTPSGV